MKFKHFATIAAMTLAGAANSQAALIAYDGFGSGANNVNLDGLGGGTGFSTNWAFTAGSGDQKHNTDTQPGSSNFFYPSNVPLTYSSGITQHASNFNNSIGTRTLAGGNTIDFSANGEYYISFILRDFAADPNNEATVSFANATSQYHFGYRYTDKFGIGTSTQSQRLGEGAFTDSASTFAGNTTYFVVGQVITSASGNDQINLKAYRSATDLVDSSAANVASWTVTSSLASNQIYDRIGIASAGSNFISLDEIRVGTEWVDVTGIPEPSAALLGAFGALALLRRRRA